MGQNLSALGQDLRVASSSPEKNLWGIITPPEKKGVFHRDPYDGLS